MARAAAALVLCAAVLVATAHPAAGRVLEYQALEAGTKEAEAALALLTPALSPAGSMAADVAADAGGSVVREHDGRERGGGAIADVLWFVLEWANRAAAGGDRRKAY